MKNDSIENEYEEDNYLAGLWSRGLTGGLIWGAYHGSQFCRSKPPFQYVAPLWSWVSLTSIPACRKTLRAETTSWFGGLKSPPRKCIKL